MDRPTHRNRHIAIGSAVVVAALLLAAGAIGMQLASDGYGDGDGDAPGARTVLGSASTRTAPAPTTIAEHQAPTDQRLVAALGAPALVELANPVAGAGGEVPSTEVTVDEAVVQLTEVGVIARGSMSASPLGGALDQRLGPARVPRPVRRSHRELPAGAGCARSRRHGGRRRRPTAHRSNRSVRPRVDRPRRHGWFAVGTQGVGATADLQWCRDASRETLLGATVTLTPHVEVCATTLGLPACVRL